MVLNNRFVGARRYKLVTGKINQKLQKGCESGSEPTDVERTVKQTQSVLWPAVKKAAAVMDVDVGVSYDSDRLYER